MSDHLADTPAPHTATVTSISAHRSVLEPLPVSEQLTMPLAGPGFGYADLSTMTNPAVPVAAVPFCRVLAYSVADQPLPLSHL